MDLELRPATADEFDDMRAAVRRGFGQDSDPSDESRDGAFAVADMTRSRVVVDGGRMVGTSGAYPFQMSVPGGTVPTSGLTAVTVAPTHRRQGLLTAMMRAHFEDAAERGEPVSSLWASETAIYGRFGYGSSMDIMGVKVDTKAARLRRPEHPDEVRFVDRSEAEAILPPLHEKLRVARPGTMNRTADWWTHRHFADLKDWRDGATERRYVIVSRAGEDVGFAAFRQKSAWTSDLPEGEVRVEDAMAADDEAAASLWSFLATIDLFPRLVIQVDQPLDSELPWLAENSRAVTRSVGDGTWQRLVDVSAALEARSYRWTGDLVFSVEDDFLPANRGRYLLSVDGDGKATCHREADAPDGRDPLITASGLGALYFGSRSGRAVRAGGQLRAGDDQIDGIDAAFGWHPSAWCPDGF